MRLDAYLARVGLNGRPALAELHRAHATTIPFENLDPRRGRPVSLALEDLQDKLVDRRRGGYCFEHNVLLAAAMRELGAEVEPMLARVRHSVPPTAYAERPRSHLVLRVRDGAGEWHADVGFGRGTLLEPIPFGVGGPYDQGGWQFRVVSDGDELVLQSFEEGEWVDNYAFLPRPVPFVDLETSSWFTCTHPSSPFVTGLVVCAQSTDGVRTTLSDWSGELLLAAATPAGITRAGVAADELARLLVDRFGLPAELS
ncbi:MAG TPA: arylamine N-acetyltransferase [Solirubrobacteraceae bacterium]|nr:arylamine N-acetyltransferase [Solirubrobacteraceae bacterium]